MKSFFVFTLSGIFSFFLISCGSKNNETSIPDASGIENFSEASLNILNEAIDEDPSNDVLYYKRALFYNQHQNFNKAIVDVTKAIELEDSKGEYYLLQGEVNYASGNLLMAKESALKAEALLENVPALMVLQSNIYLDLKDSVKYNHYIEKAVTLIPFKADADYILARKALMNKDSSRSLHFLQVAVKKDPNFLPAYKEIIRIYLNKALYDSSMSYVLNGIRISHQDPLFYEAEGRFFEKMRLFGAAESAYLIALKYSNNNPQYYRLLGSLKARTGDYSKALSWYNLLLNASPTNVEVLKTCGEFAMKSRTWDKSVNYYSRLMATDSSNTFYKNQYQVAIRNSYAQDSTGSVQELEVVHVPVKHHTDQTNIDSINKSHE